MSWNWTSTERELTRAILERDLEQIGGIVDSLRFKAGLTYTEIFAFARKLTGVDDSSWEELLFEVDCFEEQQMEIA